MSTIANLNTVDNDIYACLNLDKPKSFFLFAGAGTGKTKTLVEVLKRFQAENVFRLRLNNQKVAVITYTNAACDEIKKRLEFDSSFLISTIHSFAWELIQYYTIDIRNWLTVAINNDIADLVTKQVKTKNKNTKTYIDRDTKIESKRKRLNSLQAIRKFTYNPNGDNTSRDSLSHSEVIYITADFIIKRPLMQLILIRKYPILLIDESQDTKKELVDAFFEVQMNHSKVFALGMFGDTMQRIYTDGKVELGQNIPATWAKPSKEINYRCPKRVVNLINKIRAQADGQFQTPNKDAEGIVRMFIVDTTKSFDTALIEAEIFSRMASITGDVKWINTGCEVKILTLEHHMAAKRGGFSTFFDPLYDVDKFKTGLLDGTLTGNSLFSKQLLPLVKAKQKGDKFEMSRIVRKYSPLIKKDVLKNSNDATKLIEKAKFAVDDLYTLWDGSQDPNLKDILIKVYLNGLFQIPDVLLPIAKRLNSPSETSNEGEDLNVTNDAWEAALSCKFSDFEEYVRYISDESRYGTHQGIKGLQFPRVMVILDDAEARGFLFSYDKLFGAKESSQTDIDNISEGKETGLERTRRLFYVTCSRAEESLAIVAYTQEPKKVNDYILSQEWFEEDEVIIL